MEDTVYHGETGNVIRSFDRSLTHQLLARENHDDRARIGFVVGLKKELRTLAVGNRHAFRKDGLLALRAKLFRDPESAEEIAPAMSVHPYYRLWSCLSRSAQDMMWEAISEVVRNDLQRMKTEAGRLQESPVGKGSLKLNADMLIPIDVLATEIHCQPGGYARDLGPGDLMAGALYESGGNAYSLGAGIGSKDSKAGAIIRFLGERFPGFAPKRILDIGCSAGAASTAYAAHFPEAEVHAIDIGPAMLRYAHARAEALGVPVYFHQMDATDLTFEDGSFDLVVSHNVMHELSSKSLRGMMSEAFRVSRQGGIAIHQDVPVRYKEASPFERFMFSWETRFNNEPFWEVFAQTDLVEPMIAAGFDTERVEEKLVPKLDGPGAWYAICGHKPEFSFERDRH